MGESKEILDPFHTADIKVRIGNILFNIILDLSFVGKRIAWAKSSHTHAFYELHFITGGSGEFYHTEGRVHFKAGDIIIISPGIYHFQIENEPVNKLCMSFSFRISKSQTGFHTADNMNRFINILNDISCICIPDKYNCVELIKMINNEFMNKNIGYRSFTQALFSMIIINIIRGISNDSHCVYQSAEPVRDMNNVYKRSEMIDAFFEENYQNNVTILDLAKCLFLSTSQTNRVIKKLYNTSFKQKLQETRIEQAKRLIEHYDMPISEVSENVGYLSESNFYKAFKKHTGTTPYIYRNKKKESIKTNE